MKLLGLLLLPVVLIGCTREPSVPESLLDDVVINTQTEHTPDSQSEIISTKENMASHIVTLTTDKGVIVFEMYEKAAPKTVANFISKVESGFYNDLTFHRVEDWVVQGGDPEGTGMGGERIESEYNDIVFKTGSVGIARGTDKAFNNDSQFFICKTDCDFLTGDYTNFGTVTKGQDVANAITIGDKIKSVSVTPVQE